MRPYSYQEIWGKEKEGKRRGEEHKYSGNVSGKKPGWEKRGKKEESPVVVARDELRFF